MSSNQGTYADIYDLLCEGKQLELCFGSYEEMTAFKIGLHKYRRGVADSLASLGEPTEKSNKELTFSNTYSKVDSTGHYTVVALTDKQATRKFNFTIVS